MGKGRKEKENSVENPKRRLSSDGVSPNLKQESKSVRIEMGEQEIKDMNNRISGMEKKLEKLDMLDKLDEILAWQHQHTASISNLEKRVDDLEDHVVVLRERHHEAVSREEFDSIKKKNHTLEQALLNDRLIIMNLPLSIANDKNVFDTTVENIMKALNVPINESHFEAFDGKSRDKKTATVTLKFSSSLLKSRAVRNFRNIKKSIADNCPLLVENLITLPPDHFLNGKRIMISNKLTQHNMQLLKHARTKVPSHFSFVYDTPESIIKAKIGDNFYKIETEDDIDRLVKEVDSNRGASKKTLAKNANITPRTTRSQINK